MLPSIFHLFLRIGRPDRGTLHRRHRPFRPVGARLDRRARAHLPAQHGRRLICLRAAAERRARLQRCCSDHAAQRARDAGPPRVRACPGAALAALLFAAAAAAAAGLLGVCPGRVMSRAGELRATRALQWLAEVLG